MTGICALPSSAALSSHGGDPRNNRRRKQAIGF
jgi:hypothetical protein